MNGERTLVLAEEFSGDAHYGKTLRGVLRFRREDIAAIVDSTRAGEAQDGVPIFATVEEALAAAPDVTVALVGVATQGGRFPASWRPSLEAALRAGLAFENGLHHFLSDDPEWSALAAAHGAELRDLRRAPTDLDCPTGANLELDVPVVHTVGSDCAIGKMTMGLEIDLAARDAGIRSVFVPTGQTGIMIAGWGIAVDAVVADFIAGAAERLVVEGARRGGELLIVEGQGALTHPAYSGVTLGLMHGSAPHALILCHKAGTTEVDGYPGHPLLSLPELVTLYELMSLPARKARVVCIALNTADLDDDEAAAAIAAAEAETGLPADDPVRHGGTKLLQAVGALVR